MLQKEAVPETKAALCSVHQITQLRVTERPLPLRKATLVFSREQCWAQPELEEQLLEHDQAMLQQGKAEQGSLHHWQVAVDNWTLLEKHLCTPTNTPCFCLTPQATTAMKLPLLFSILEYMSVGNRCSLILPVLPQLVAHRPWVWDSHWIPPVRDLQSGTQRAPKKMTGVARYAAEIRSVDTAYLPMQALCAFNSQAFRPHIHHAQSKTEYLLLCAPHSVYRQSIPTSITFTEIEPICKCWASISLQWPELQ